MHCGNFRRNKWQGLNIILLFFINPPLSRLQRHLQCLENIKIITYCENGLFLKVLEKLIIFCLFNLKNIFIPCLFLFKCSTNCTTYICRILIFIYNSLICVTIVLYCTLLFLQLEYFWTGMIKKHFMFLLVVLEFCFLYQFFKIIIFSANTSGHLKARFMDGVV